MVSQSGWEPAPMPMTPRTVGAAMVNPQNNAPAPPGSLAVPPKPAADVPLPWSQLPGNILPSGGRVLSGIYDAFRHPIDTATALGTLGDAYLPPSANPDMAGGAEGMTSNVGAAPALADARASRVEETKPLRDASINALDQRYGNPVRLRNSMITDPVGVALDASTIATPFKAGALIDPITQAGNALKYGAKVPEIAGANTLGFTTGAGTRSIRDAGSAGRELGLGVGKPDEVINNAAAVTDNMNRGGSAADVVDRFKGALDQVRQERGQAYRQGMRDLGKDIEPMNFQPIEDAVNKASEVGTFKGVSVEPAASGTIDKMRAIVDQWKGLDPTEYHTPVGIDALKRSLGNIRDSTPYGTPERVAADRVYNGVRAELTARAPEYSKIMEGYGKASEQIKEASSALSLGPKASTDTAARKILSATRNNVQTNFGERARIVDQLAEKDSTLPYAIAGQALQAPLPRGIVARGGLAMQLPAIAAAILHNPITAAIAVPTLAASSPRIVGNAVYYGGRAIGTVEDVAKAMKINPDTLRAMERGGYQAGQNNALQGNPYVGAR